MHNLLAVFKAIIAEMAVLYEVYEVKAALKFLSGVSAYLKERTSVSARYLSVITGKDYSALSVQRKFI